MDSIRKPTEKPSAKPSGQKKQLEALAKYSSLGFQMLFIILAGVFGGIKLDQWVHWEFPVFTLVLSVCSVGLSVYYAIRDLIKFN